MSEDDTAVAEIAEDKAAEADFGAGFAGTKGKPDKPEKDKPEPAATPRVEAKPEPVAEKFVQISEKDWADIKAAAARTASYDQQFSKLFGTTGQMQKMLNEQRAAGQPAPVAAVAKKLEIPKDAFAAMERDFPELAQQTRAALEAALSGLPTGANDADPAKLESLLQTYTAKREIEALEDAWPEWRTIVGAVAQGEQPDPANPFRKWLSEKDAAYQQRVNGAESAAIIGRSIRLFQKETATPAKAAPAPRNDARAAVIRAAVQPRGDNAGGGGGRSENDDFEDGFRSARG